jgi:FkbM family methyltransferase
MRRLSWRLGRKIYTAARGEVTNTMASNGELRLLQATIDLGQRAGRPIVLVDIGSNLGEWTLGALTHARSKGIEPHAIRVFAFEPVSGTRAMLTRNLTEAGFASQVVVSDLAISDRASSRTINVLADGAGTNSLERDDGDSDALTAQSVETETLTAFVDRNGLDRIALVKCDTEGHDAFVLEGAASLLQAGRIDALQFEYNHRWIHARRFLKDVFDLLRTTGAPYHLARVRSDRLEVMPTWHPELDRFFETNYVLVHHDRAEAFQLHFGRFDAANTYA